MQFGFFDRDVVKKKLTDVEISVKYGTVFIVKFEQYYQVLVKNELKTSSTLNLEIVHMVTKYRREKKSDFEQKTLVLCNMY